MENPKDDPRFEVFKGFLENNLQDWNPKLVKGAFRTMALVCISFGLSRMPLTLPAILGRDLSGEVASR